MADTRPDIFRGAPPVFYINLDRATDRRQHLEQQFRTWGIGATRIAAIDGAVTPPDAFLEGSWPVDVSAQRLACYASHLFALKAFLDSGADRALIMEDDCSLETVPFWPFSWQDAEALLPFDADIVQLSLISETMMTMRLHRRHITNYSAAAYLITRRYAAKLLDLHFGGDKPCLNRDFRPELTSEVMLFEPGSAYTIPLFSYETGFASTLRAEHVDRLHRPCREIAMRFWREVVPTLDDWRVLFDYNPAFGRIPSPPAGAVERPDRMSQ